MTVPPRSVPYNLKERVDKAIKEMIDQDVIEEHPTTEPQPWISCAAIAPKPDGNIRMTLDAQSTNSINSTTGRYQSPVSR